MTRVEGYGYALDRGRTLTVTVNGRAYPGHPGDTLASVLLAHDVAALGTSVKYGRPRGITGAWTEDPTGLVQIEEPFPEPMLLATTVEITEGLVARGVGGQGRLAQVPDHARYDRRHTHCDVLVVGAGPAGLARRARRGAGRGRRRARRRPSDPRRDPHRHRATSTAVRRGSSSTRSSPSSPPTPR